MVWKRRDCPDTRGVTPSASQKEQCVESHSIKTICEMHSQELPKGHVCIIEIHSDLATANDSNAFMISSCKNGEQPLGSAIPSALVSQANSWCTRGLCQRQAHARVVSAPFEYFKLHSASFRTWPTRVCTRSRSARKTDAPSRPAASHVELSYPSAV